MAQILKSLDGATTSSNGTALEFNAPIDKYSMQYTVSSVSGTVKVYLEGSMDGVNFFPSPSQGATLTGTGTFSLDAANAALAAFIRARLEIGGGGSATVTAYVAGKVG